MNYATIAVPNSYTSSANICMQGNGHRIATFDIANNVPIIGHSAVNSQRPRNCKSYPVPDKQLNATRNNIVINLRIYKKLYRITRLCGIQSFFQCIIHYVSNKRFSRRYRPFRFFRLVSAEVSLAI